jgi:hypothetical protein
MAVDVDEATAVVATDESPAGPGQLARAGLLAIVILPIVVAVVRALRRNWFPIGDNALLYIRTADVFTEHHPFLGSWTSASLSLGVNLNNPGPTYDLLIAPFAQFLSPGPGAAIGVGAVNIASIIGISFASRRMGGWAMQRWMLLAAAGLAWSMGSEMLIDIWQAHALLLPFLLFLVLLVGCTAGMSRFLPAAAGVGTLLIQTHISYAYILVFLIGTSLATLWWLHRPVDWRQLPGSLRSRVSVITFAVLVVLWAHPLYEQFFGEGQGNLSRLVSNSSGGSLTLGLTDATKITSSIMALPWWWTRLGYSTTVPDTPLTLSDDGAALHLSGGLPGFFVAFLALVVITVGLGLLTRSAHGRGSALQTSAGVLATVASPAVVASLSLLTIGPVGLSAHHVRWVWSLSVFVTFVAVWLGAELWSATRDRAETRWLTPAAIVMTVVLSLLNLAYVAHPEGPVTDYSAMPAMRRVFPEIGVLADHDPVLYDTSNLRVFEPYSSTMMMRMQELGVEFRVADEIWVRQLGNNRRANGAETTVVFQLEGIEALNYGGPACTIALTSALSVPAENAARTNAELFAAELVDGAITIDEAMLTEDDPIDQLGAAQEGDHDAAWLLVIDGTLSRWVTDGIAASPNTNLATELDEIFNWMLTSYGLFAEGPWDCPNP